MYGSAVRKQTEESTEQNGIEEHIAAAAEGCEYLYLWLDCDREGENICYEILKVCTEELSVNYNILTSQFVRIHRLCTSEWAFIHRMADLLAALCLKTIILRFCLANFGR